jgi:hypothetical protein
MADIIPQGFITAQASKEIDFNNNLIKCILCDGAYDETALRDVKTYSEISANEIGVGAGYNYGGVDVSGTSAYSDDVNNRTVYVCTDIFFPASGGNVGPARYAVMYDSTSVSGTPIYSFDFGVDKTIIDSTNLIIRVDPTGFIKGRQL